jgi:Lar family restriction alleviation protein
MKMKPCPFCGGEPFVEDSARKEEIIVIQCQECFGEGPIGETKAEAIGAWNKRVTEK